MSAGDSLFSSSAGTMAVVALLLSLLALAGVVFLLARQQRLLGQYQHLMTGTSGGNLDTVLNDHIARVHAATAQVEVVERRTQRLETAAQSALHRVGIVRYNPFHDTGGDQSFAMALADDHGNGVILSSLHARDLTRVYGKPLLAWGSTYSLTEEEKQAIALAQEERA